MQIKPQEFCRRGTKETQMWEVQVKTLYKILNITINNDLIPSTCAITFNIIHQTDRQTPLLAKITKKKTIHHPNINDTKPNTCFVHVFDNIIHLCLDFENVCRTKGNHKS